MPWLTYMKSFSLVLPLGTAWCDPEFRFLTVLLRAIKMLVTFGFVISPMGM